MNRQRECALKNQFEELRRDSYRKLQIYVGKKDYYMPCTCSKEMKVLNAARRAPDEKVRMRTLN